MSGTNSARIFLSYRRDDTRHMAGRLFDRLADQFGDSNVFMDVDSIEPGLDFGEVIDRAVGECDVLLALIGRAWLSEIDEHGYRRLDDPDDLVFLEIKAALDRGIRVVPILVDGAAAPRREELPAALVPLARRNAVRVDHETFRSDVRPLLDILDRGDHPTPASRGWVEGKAEASATQPPARPASGHRMWGLLLLWVGVVLAVLGYVTGISLGYSLGLLLLVVGLIVLVLGRRKRPG